MFATFLYAAIWVSVARGMVSEMVVLLRVFPNSTLNMEEVADRISWFQNKDDRIDWMGTSNSCVVKIPYTDLEAVEKVLREMRIRYNRILTVRTKSRRQPIKNRAPQANESGEVIPTINQNNEFPIFERAIYKIIKTEENTGLVIDKINGSDGITHKSFSNFDELDDFYFEILGKQRRSCISLSGPTGQSDGICLVFEARLKSIKKEYSGYGLTFRSRVAYFTTYFDDKVLLVFKDQSVPGFAFLQTPLFRNNWGNLVFTGSKLNIQVISVSSTGTSVSRIRHTSFTNFSPSQLRVASLPITADVDLKQTFKKSKQRLSQEVGFANAMNFFHITNYDDKNVFSYSEDAYDIPPFKKCVLLQGQSSLSFIAGIEINVAMVAEVTFLNTDYEAETKSLATDQTTISRIFGKNNKISQNGNTIQIKIKKLPKYVLALPYQALDCSVPQLYDRDFCEHNK